MIKLNRRSSQQNGIRRMNHSHMHECDFSPDENIDHIEKDEYAANEGTKQTKKLKLKLQQSKQNI